MKILVVEDNHDLALSTQEFLLREGYICEISASYTETVEKLSIFTYDCVLLDIMLPDGNGLEVLDMMKSEHQNTNILITSAKNSLDDKITGLEGGADDYLTKPYHLSELNARIRTIYRRKTLQGSALLRFNELELNTNTFEAFVNGHLLDLTRKEFDLLLYFIINKNRVLSRQAIATHLWGDYTDDLSNFDFVYQHVKNLRKKISQAGGNDYVTTVYGMGYKFNANETGK
ncbi:MAG: response regulator transcription factor [Chitinophagaceae bacterium]